MAELALPAVATRRGFVSRAFGHKSFLIGAVLTGAMALTALVSLFWTPHSATAIDIRAQLQPPSWSHWLGTDQMGRDVLSMIMVGAQTSIVVGVVAVGIGILCGVPLGLVASARRGWIEETLMRLTDFTYAFPVILVAILIVGAWGPGVTNSIIAIGIYDIAIFARIVRGSANAVWSRDFIAAARAAGKGVTRITVEHVLPNITSAVVVQATILFAIAILAEAALSFLGVGTQPPTPSWGRMLSENQTAMFFAPRLAVFPGCAIVLMVLGLNLLGDGLRDLMDPRLARQR